MTPDSAHIPHHAATALTLPADEMQQRAIARAVWTDPL